MDRFCLAKFMFLSGSKRKIYHNRKELIDKGESVERFPVKVEKYDLGKSSSGDEIPERDMTYHLIVLI